VAASVVVLNLWRRREPSRTQELIVEREVGSAERPTVSARDMFPPVTGEEPVIAAVNQLRSVLQRHAIGRPDRRPMAEYLSDDVAGVAPAALRPVDAISRTELADRPGSPISHKDRCFTPAAVRARM